MADTNSQKRYYPNQEAVFNTSRVIVDRVSQISARILIDELQELIDYKDVRDNIPNGIMLYVYTAAFLSFSARAINAENISNVVRSIGVKPDQKLIDMLVNNNIRGHLIYVYATYLLLAAGIMPEKETIRKVVESIGEKVDEKAAAETKYLVEAIQNI